MTKGYELREKTEIMSEKPRKNQQLLQATYRLL